MRDVCVSEAFVYKLEQTRVVAAKPSRTRLLCRLRFCVDPRT